MSSPRVSQAPMSNCVMIAPSASRRWIGMTSSSGFARHDHAGRVHAPLALEALQAPRGVDDLLDLRVGLVERADLGGLGVALVGRVEHPGQRDVLAHDRAAASPW